MYVLIICVILIVGLIDVIHPRNLVWHVNLILAASIVKNVIVFIYHFILVIIFTIMLKNQLKPNKIRYIIILPIIFILEGFYMPVWSTLGIFIFYVLFLICIIALPVILIIFIVRYFKKKSDYYQAKTDYYKNQTNHTDRQD